MNNNSADSNQTTFQTAVLSSFSLRADLQNHLTAGNITGYPLDAPLLPLCTATVLARTFCPNDRDVYEEFQKRYNYPIIPSGGVHKVWDFGQKPLLKELKKPDAKIKEDLEEFKNILNLDNPLAVAISHILNDIKSKEESEEINITAKEFTEWEKAIKNNSNINTGTALINKIKDIRPQNSTYKTLGSCFNDKQASCTVPRSALIGTLFDTVNLYYDDKNKDNTKAENINFFNQNALTKLQNGETVSFAITHSRGGHWTVGVLYPIFDQEGNLIKVASLLRDSMMGEPHLHDVYRNTIDFLEKQEIPVEKHVLSIRQQCSMNCGFAAAMNAADFIAYYDYKKSKTGQNLKAFDEEDFKLFSFAFRFQHGGLNSGTIAQKLETNIFNDYYSIIDNSTFLDDYISSCKEDEAAKAVANNYRHSEPQPRANWKNDIPFKRYELLKRCKKLMSDQSKKVADQSKDAVFQGMPNVIFEILFNWTSRYITLDDELMRQEMVFFEKMLEKLKSNDLPDKEDLLIYRQILLLESQPYNRIIPESAQQVINAMKTNTALTSEQVHIQQLTVKAKIAYHKFTNSPMTKNILIAGIPSLTACVSAIFIINYIQYGHTSPITAVFNTYGQSFVDLVESFTLGRLKDAGLPILIGVLCGITAFYCFGTRQLETEQDIQTPQIKADHIWDALADIDKYWEYLDSPKKPPTKAKA